MPTNSTPDEVMPGYLELAKCTYVSVSEFAFDWEKYPVDYEILYKRFTSVSREDVTWIVGLAISLTLGRHLLTQFLYLPFGRWLELRKQDLRKFSESAWKLKMFSFLWMYSCHVIIFSGRHDYFINPCRIWNITFPRIFIEPIPYDIQLMYLLQIAFYVHSIYATVAMDVWRKDSVMMLLHHSITIMLLYFSYCMRYYKMGSLVLFLHDLNDVVLEFTKLNVYLKSRGGKTIAFNDNLASLGFLTFTVSWAWMRLYWYPLKVLYSTNCGVYQFHRNKDPKLYLVLNSMLFLLQILHIYWFYFILVFFYKIVTGKASQVEDTREYDSDDSEDVDRTENTKKVAESNGSASNHIKSEVSTNGCR